MAGGAIGKLLLRALPVATSGGQLRRSRVEYVHRLQVQLQQNAGDNPVAVYQSPHEVTFSLFQQ